jgi:hypothetical protein
VKRQLIVNADDYGRTAGVCRGILEAHRRGIVTSTTVMINQPGIEAHLARAQAHPRLGLGLHLVFTHGRPVLPPAHVPGLVDETGCFIDHHTAWAQAESVPPEQLLEEFRAQVARFRALTGRLPDHVDCHQFAHLYPPFFQAYTSLAQAYGLPLRVPFPLQTDFQAALPALPYLEGFPPDRVRGMIVTNSNLVRARKLAHPDHFVGTFFGREFVTLDYLLALLEGLPPGAVSELMCHPGYDDADLAASSYRRERERELALLVDPAVRRRLEALEIELVTFAALQAPT